MASIQERLKAAAEKARYEEGVRDRLVKARDAAIKTENFKANYVEPMTGSERSDRANTVVARQAREEAAEAEKAAGFASALEDLNNRFDLKFDSQLMRRTRDIDTIKELEGERDHAQSMYDTYSQLHGSYQTSPEEKKIALEQKTRFETELQRLDTELGTAKKNVTPSPFLPQYDKIPSYSDFDVYSTEPEAKEPTDDVSTYLKDAKAKTDKAVSGTPVLEVEREDALNFLTDTERKTYTYLKNKHGAGMAEVYLNSMSDSIAQRRGDKIAQHLESQKGPARVVQTGGFAMRSGLEQFGQGVEQAFKDEVQPVTPVQYGAQYVREDLADVGPKVLGRSLGQMAFDTTQTVGNMLPSMIISMGASALSAPAKLAKLMGAGAMGTSAGGNTYATAVREGMDPDEAREYARLVGTAAGLLQYAIGGIDKLSGGYGAKLTAKAAGIENGFLRFIAKHGASGLSETTEEGLEAILDPVFKEIATGDDANIDWAEVTYNALLGGLVGFLLGGDGEAETAQPNVEEESGRVPRLPRVTNTQEETRTVPPLPKVGTNAERATQGAVPPLPKVGTNITAQSDTDTEVEVTSGQSALNKPQGLAYMLASNISTISDMDAVKALTGREMNDRTKKASEQIADFFRRIGNSVIRKGFGEVHFNNYGVGGMLNHRPLNRAKMVALTAAPEVIREGRIINDDPNWKGRGYRSITFAAPVTINGTTVYVAAVVDQRPDNKFYLTECVDSEGNYVRIKETPSGNTKSGVTAQSGITTGPEGVYNSSISQTASDYKKKGAENTNPPASNSRMEAENTAEANRRRFDSWDAYWANLQRRKADASLVYDNATDENFISARDAYIAVEAEERAAKRLKDKWESDGWTIPQSANADSSHSTRESSNEEEYEGTEATDRLGIKIASPITGLKGAEDLVARQKAAYKNRRLLAQKIKELQPTMDEREFAKGIAKGIYTEDSAVIRFGDKIEKMNMAKVLEIADYYKAVEGFDVDMLAYKRRENTRNEEEKAEKLLANSDAYQSPKTSTLNFNTMKRNILQTFGQQDGTAINARYFDPVTQNSAERIRFINRMHDRVRKFKLSKGESELVQLVMEGTAVANQVSKMTPDLREKIINAAESTDVSEGSMEFGLNAEQRKVAEDYAKWLDTQTRLQDPDVDADKVERAAKAYSEAYDDFYAATNDFLVSHGYEPIGYIKGYAPHLQPEQVQSGVAEFLKRIGLDAAVSELPTEIAGRTADFKPGKQWNPYFQHRNGNNAQVDAVEGYESYVHYMSNVFYHTDDIQKLRVLSNTLRTKYSNEEISNRISHAKGLYNAPTEVKLDYLVGENRVAPDATLSAEEIDTKLEEYVSSLYDSVKNLSRFGPLVTAIDDYANKLAGKQTKLDRAVEEGLIGRGALNWGNKLSKRFGESTIVGNLSSALNQMAQLPMVQMELGNKYVAQAVMDMLRGEADSLDFESDFITGKLGTKDLTTERKWKDRTGVERYSKAMDIGAIPFTAVDNFASRLIVRASYLKNIEKGMSHEKAVREADNFAERVVGNRIQGGRPMIFESKNVFTKLFTTFQLEVANTWSHINKDLKWEIQETAQREGRNAAIKKTAGMLATYAVEAFLLNRLCEALYGGTPAPLDLLGYIVGGVAKGFGETTNAFIANLILNVFGAGEEEDDEFDAEAMLSEMGNLAVGDIPYVRNLASMAGYGDSSLPLPKLPTKTAESLWDNIMASIKGEETDWGETGDYALSEVTSWLPMGNQAKKTVQGIQTVAKRGRYAGDELMYPVDISGFGGALNVAKAILFGNSALGQTDAYYAADARRLSAKQTATYEALVGAGEDMDIVYDTIMKVRGVKDVPDSDADGKEKRDIIRNADISDLSKAALYSTLIGDGQDDKFAVLMDARLGWDAVMDVYEAYKAISDNETLTKTQQATEFAKWADDNHYEKIADLIKETFKFWNMVPAEASDYAKFTDAGLSDNSSKELADAIGVLKPIGDAKQVSDYQKLRAVAESDLSSKEKNIAFSTIMSDSQFEKWQEASSKLLSTEFINGLEIYNKAEGKKDSNGETISGSKAFAVMQGIDDLGMSDEKKEFLFEALGYDTAETIWNTEYDGDDYEAYFYMTDSARQGYMDYCSWMKAGDYAEYYEAYSTFFSDKDSNGKTVKAKKEKVIEYIDSLDLTADQKSALFVSFGYAKSSLKDCIWYNPIAMRSKYFPAW